MSVMPEAASEGTVGRTHPAGALRRFCGRMVPVAAALVMVVMIYRRVAMGRVLARGDLQIYFYPYWMQVVRSLRAGHLPLWNNTLFAGAPLAANSQVGLFYPMNWPFWLLSLMPAGVSTPTDLWNAALVARTLHLNVLAHLWLATLSSWYLGRRLGLSSWAAAVAGLVYAGGGFLGVHVDHLNQLQALAWLPLLFLPEVSIRPRVADGGASSNDVRLWRMPRALSVAAMGMVVLSGHMQMAFIAAVGVVIWHSLQAVAAWTRSQKLPRVGVWRARSLWGWVAGLLPYATAGLLAGGQLLPTLQLAGLSGRSTGLDWREAVSFSLAPWDVLRALLPGYLAPPVLPEGVAFIGLSGLAIAGVGAVSGLVDDRRRGQGLLWGLLAAIGLALALGAYNPLYLAAVRLSLPGFIHFRAPARFLALYAVGISVLAGLGAQVVIEHCQARVLARTRRSPWQQLAVSVAGVIIVAVVGLDLVVAAEALPHAQATAARAYYDLRPATAHLVAGSEIARAEGRVPSRFLSISEMLFEIGDKPEIEIVYGDTLSPDALWSTMVAAKQREILAPNLPLVFDVPAADGYDGGLLPLRHFIAFSELLIPGGTLDGRLREGLSQIPDGRWLDLLGVQYILTDKTQDLWVGDILYDRQFQTQLTTGETLEVGWLPEHFEATAVGVLYTGGPLQISLRLSDGRVLVGDLPGKVAGDAADGGLQESAWIRWSGASAVASISITGGQTAAQLSAVSLADERDGTFYPLTLSTRYRQVHSGDVKIYEALTPPSRASIVRSCLTVDSDEGAIRTMSQASFSPSEALVMTPGAGEAGCSLGALLNSEADDEVAVTRYTDNEVVVDVTLATPGYLLLKDAWYPGWRVEIRDQLNDSDAPIAAPVMRADLLFRAVALEAGSWRVTFRFLPYILYSGLGLTFGGVACWVCYIVVLRRRCADRTSSGFVAHR